MKEAPAAIVKMTGPHPSRSFRGGQPGHVWKVAVVGAGRGPQGTVYRSFSYTRATRLACNMARDRRLFLHIEALPA